MGFYLKVRVFNMMFVKAFVVGGIICALVQILVDRTKLQPGRIMVLLVVSGVILGAVGIYKKLDEFAGCGASVPLCGFGYSLWKGMKEAIDTHGFLGLFEGGFTAAAVGTSAALIFSYLASFVFKPKIKK
jgi:stage V sporulation protein AE